MTGPSFKEPTAQFWSAYAAYAADLPTVPKDSRADVRSPKGNFSYGFTSMPILLAAVVPSLLRHGLTICQATFVEGGNLMLRTYVVHVPSSEALPAEMHVCPLSVGGQSMGSLLSFSRRYAVLTACLIAGQDDDDGLVAVGADATTGPTPQRRAAKAASPPARQDGSDALDAALADNAKASKRPSARAAILAEDARFRRYLWERHGVEADDAESATEWLRSHLGVESRSQLDAAPDGPAAKALAELAGDFGVWLRL